MLYLEKEKELANNLDRLWDLGSETGEDYFHHLEEYQLSVYHPARRLFPMISEERLNEIAQSPNFQRWFNAEKVHTEFKDENHLPKIFYRGLNIEPDDIHTVKTGNETVVILVNILLILHEWQLVTLTIFTTREQF